MDQFKSDINQAARKWLKATLTFAVIPAALFILSPQTSGDREPASVSALRNWGLDNTLNSHIHAKDAWKIETGSKEIVVSVIDTGIDPNHNDIRPNLWKDVDGKTFGFDFVTGKANPIDDHGHGTHVAGILGAALNARMGIAGVAQRVSIMPVKYYSDQNSGAENLKNSIKALNWAIDHGAKIINYSGGGPEFSQEEYIAIRRAREKGILIVAAAGNERQNTDVEENFYYPCAYRLDNIICVAAVNIKGELLPSSNWGKVRVDVAAPGQDILSTIPGGRYSYMSGTSQATAFVTGLAALLLSKDRSLSPSQIKEIIRASVDKLPTLRDKVFSGGRVNAYAALMQLEKTPKVLPVIVGNRGVAKNKKMALQKSEKDIASSKMKLPKVLKTAEN